MYIHKCFKPSKCLPFGNVLAQGEHVAGVYTQEGCKRLDWHSVSMDDCNGNFFFSLTKADSIVPIS